ncbi:DUF4426 domain-containing protein [Shewanella intestini]|uniref:DUF4426 domain-containing protein n=1 Tax=Shewanella intestini TaxID=2017544 RepID=A0ABS5I2G6_9GAMM|nr:MULTISPECIES: DUF4426 domain-containing protein [Shewanella]MBR9728224.1 DUF4426 domain-containing protein [Shewanella intestini]MRG35689.1 DUF4426 domain-containing protein [Shewanella sp. XMDDZSB0408]
MLFFSPTTFAGQKQQVGKFDIHYMALDSTFLTPAVAKKYGITRSQYRSIVNITVLDTSQEGNPPVAVKISGVAHNLLDTQKKLKFQEIREGKSIYYIAQLSYRDNQETRFKIAIQHGTDLNTTIHFKRKFYVN